jgi:hemoglobin-like flavoprotein
MTPRQIELVQASFETVQPIADKAADLFYDRLFSVTPELKSA